MKKKVIAVFDIGKTNKKCFLFDDEFNELRKEYTNIAEIKDEDGDPCDNLQAIVDWIFSTLDKIMASQEFDLKMVNFSTYGASLVHINKKGKPLAPLYNYLKAYPKAIVDQFKVKYQGVDVAVETASPLMEMLNSGLQLYWLKYSKPEVYRNVHQSLHLPQYLSYLFTGSYFSDYTSLGCHTMMWDFEENDYHQWFCKEGFDKISAPIVPTNHQIQAVYKGKEITFGVGIHDSSAALLPYMKLSEEPFLLLSTGTWSIALNPFSEEPLTKNLLDNDCLNFLRTDGNAVRAARLFLGHEFTEHVNALEKHFGEEPNTHQTMKFSQTIHDGLVKRGLKAFAFKSFPGVDKGEFNEQLDIFSTFEEAYHQLLIELMAHQVASIRLALGKTNVKRIYIDGGFASNALFVEMLGKAFEEIEIVTSASSLGSALGAALAVTNRADLGDLLEKHFEQVVKAD
jgi:L-fuculokinase